MDSVAQRGCHPSQHHVHDCSMALGRGHPIRQGGSSLASAPPPPPFPPPVDAPLPCHPVDPPVPSPAPSPPTAAPSLSPPRSPFASLPPSTAPVSGTSDLPPPVVAGPFAQHPAPPSVVTSPPVPQVSSFSPLSEFGPPRLTRYLEMSLDRYVNIVTSMINDGRFSHIGHGVLRLEVRLQGCMAQD